MASEALDPNSPAYDPIFAERVQRARENPEPAFFGAFEPGGVFNPAGTAFAAPNAPALASAPAAPAAVVPEDVFGLPGGKQLPGEASPLNALPPAPSLAATPARGDDFTRIDLGDTSTYSMPGGTATVDRSKGLSGQAWIDSQRGRSAPSSFDAMVAGPSEPAAQSATFEPGSERTYGFSGNGTVAGLLGDIQAQGLLGARDEASGSRELADLGRRAQASTFEELIRDPFAKERMQGEMDMRSRLAPILAAGRNQRLSEQERRDAYRQGRETIFQDFVKKRAELQQKGDKDALARLEEAHDEAVQAMREAFGIGARMNSGSLYETAG